LFLVKLFAKNKKIHAITKNKKKLFAEKNAFELQL
jgi:hypothetical protein